MRYIGLILALVLFLALVLGLRAPAPASAQADPAEALRGQQLVLCGYVLAAEAPLAARAPIAVTVLDGVWLPGDRAAALAVVVEATNQGSAPAGLYRALQLEDAQGRRYEPDARAVPFPVQRAIAEAFASRDSALPLQPGVPELRHVVFRVPLDLAAPRLRAGLRC